MTEILLIVKTAMRVLRAEDLETQVLFVEMTVVEMTVVEMTGVEMTVVEMTGVEMITEVAGETGEVKTIKIEGEGMTTGGPGIVVIDVKGFSTSLRQKTNCRPVTS
jgi:hypothetical protein